MHIVKFFTISLLILSLIGFVGCSKTEDNTTNNISEKNNSLTNINLNVDSVIEYIKSDEQPKVIYGYEEVEFLIKKFNQSFKVVKVNESNFIMSFNIDDGLVKINGEVTVIPDIADGIIENVTFQDSTLTYVINQNPNNESIEKNIMSYVGEQIYGPYIPSLLFLPLEGENTVTVRDTYYKKDNNISNLSVTVDFIHTDKVYTSTGSMIVLIKDNNDDPEKKLPKVSVSNFEATNTNSTIPPSLEDLERHKPDFLYTPNHIGTKLTLREYDSVKFVEAIMSTSKLGKGIVNATYVPDGDSIEKAIILDFSYKVINNKYEIQISHNTRTS